MICKQYLFNPWVPAALGFGAAGFVGTAGALPGASYSFGVWGLGVVFKPGLCRDAIGFMGVFLYGTRKRHSQLVAEAMGTTVEAIMWIAAGLNNRRSIFQGPTKHEEGARRGGGIWW